MLTNDRERKICEKYSKPYYHGYYARCFECPMYKGSLKCKAVAHWDKHRKQWIFDKENNHEQTDE